MSNQYERMEVESGSGCGPKPALSIKEKIANHKQMLADSRTLQSHSFIASAAACGALSFVPHTDSPVTPPRTSHTPHAATILQSDDERLACLDVTLMKLHWTPRSHTQSAVRV